MARKRAPLLDWRYMQKKPAVESAVDETAAMAALAPAVLRRNRMKVKLKVIAQ